jgi:Rrf2 family protein
MISQTVRYALNILGFLVRHRGSRVRGEDIAGETGVPANYLSKILNQLRKQGIVEAGKGWGGGFELRTEALERPIQDILVMFEGIERGSRNDCLFGLPQCDATHPCPLHAYWEPIRTRHQQMLTDVRIKDLGTAPN